MPIIEFNPLSQEIIGSLTEPELKEAITLTHKLLKAITDVKNCVAMQYQFLTSRHLELQRQRIIDEDRIIKIRVRNPITIKADQTAEELSQLLESLDTDTLEELSKFVSSMVKQS